MAPKLQRVSPIAPRPHPCAPKVRLGEICGLTRGVTYSKSDEVDSDGICILRANNIDKNSGALDLSDIRRIRASARPDAAKKLRRNDICICLASGSKAHIGKVALTKRDTDFYIGGFMGAVRVRQDKVNPEYLFYQLRAPSFNAFLSRRISGANINNLTARILEEFEIPLPTLAEQKRIVKSLSANLRRAEKMKTAMQAQAEAIAALPDSILAKIFERGKFPRQWKKAQVGDIAVVNPPRPDLSARPPDAQTTFIPMEAVDGKTGAANPLVRPYAEVRTGYTFFREGDVLFAKMTSSLRNRKHFIARKTRDGLGFASTEFHVLRPGGEVLAEWLHFFLRQPLVAAQAEPNFHGSAQQRVSADFVRGLEIPFPPLSEQRIIARMLKARMKVAAKLAAAARAQLDAASALSGAHLRRAFSGS